MSVDCLVCGDHSDGQHFGISACRACAAFFRRSTVSGKEYTCRFSNCCQIGKDVRCMCRACRLRKCREKGMKANCVQRYRDELGKRSSFSRSVRKDSSDSLESGSPTSSTHTLSPPGPTATFFPSCSDGPSCSSTVSWTLAPSKTPLIDQMVSGYNHLLAERTRVHSVMTIPNGRKIYDPNRVGLEQANRASCLMTIRTEVPLVIEMLRTSFPPYYDFPPHQRVQRS
uniref:Nuclear receptor domain-containing protein n=1 Tax=Steinernema glaseri TaxID=37863 RepID=A0A1I8AW21_9BILA